MENINHIIDCDYYSEAVNKAETDLNYVLRCQRYLQKLCICKSRRQFSKSFLGKSENYLSVILSGKREVPSDTINRLIFALGQYRDSVESIPAKYSEIRVLNGLIEKGQDLLMQRYLRNMQ